MMLYKGNLTSRGYILLNSLGQKENNVRRNNIRLTGGKLNIITNYVLERKEEGGS